jgi:hypothetical protein
VDVERLKTLLGPLAGSVQARCLVVNPEGRVVFATQPQTSPCPARMENLKAPICPSGGCPFKGQPYLAPMQDGALTMGHLFWCTGGHQTDRRGLTRGLAQVVTTGLMGGSGSESVVVSMGAGGGRVVAVDQIRNELNVARKMQEALLPSVVPDVEGLQLAARLRAASNVGGDYYDFVPLGGGYLGLVIADVSGHGVGSGMMMTSFRIALLAELSREFSPAAALRRVNTLLHRDCDRSRMFVTAVLAVYEPLTGNLVYANAGHNPPRMRKAGQRDVVRLEATGVPIGMFEDMEYEEASVMLDRGDALVFFTDGLIENRNAAGVALGDQGLDRALAIANGRNAKDLLAFLLSVTERHLGGAEPKDDVTVVVVTTTY